MDSKLSELLKEKRTEEGMSLRDFSKHLNISHAYLAKLEKGIDPRSGKEVKPTMEALQKIAIGLNVSQQYLLQLAKEDLFEQNTDEENDITKYFSNFILELTQQKKLCLRGKALEKEELARISTALQETFQNLTSQI